MVKMLTNYRDINYELTRQNQQMRVELSKYRNEIIKMRQDLLKQREENALLKNNLTSEFLKVSQSFKVIFQLLENANDETLNETIKDLNNSINNLNNTSYAFEKSKINTTNTSHKRENMGQSSVTGKDSSTNDTSLSNFSFEVENEETITESAEMQISIQEGEPEFIQNNVSDESLIERSGMSIIEEETISESKLEQSIRCTFNNNEVQETITPHDSLIEEESFMSLEPGLFRSTSIIPNRTTDILSPSKIPLRNCSVLLTRSTFSNIITPSTTLKDEKLSIYSKENVENINCVKDETIEDTLEPDKNISRTSIIAKPPTERRPRRKAAPTVLVEQSTRVKLRRN